jgi:tetratricopeptide (TPR) repeat protein
MESVPSAATYEIGLIHKRLGNDKDAMQCFDKVIDIDPDGRHGNNIFSEIVTSCRIKKIIPLFFPLSYQIQTLCVYEGDTGAAWDVKGTMLLQAGGKLSDAHFCFERALQLRPTDVLIRKHLKDCEALVNQGSNSGPPMSPKGPKKSKSKKEKKEKKEKKLGPRPPSFDEDEK